MTSKLIKIENLDLFLSNKKILKNINLSISINDRVGVVGKNGSGKTVLLRVLAGIYKSFNGKVILNDNFYFIAQPGVGAVENMSVLFNIKRVLLFNNVYKIDQIQLKYLIENLDLKNYLNEKFSILSEGYRLRFQFLIFMLVNSTNLIIDEFFGFGDKYLMSKFEAQVSNKYRNFQSFIVASHNDYLINKFCNRVIEIDNGSIIKDYKIE